MKDDPKRPWKAIVGGVGAAGTALIAIATDWPAWIVALVVAITAFCTYVVPNPKV